MTDVKSLLHKFWIQPLRKMSQTLSWLHANSDSREVSCAPIIIYIKLAAAIFQLEYFEQVE